MGPLAPTPDDQQFSAEDLKRAEKAINGKTSGWNLARISEALNGVKKPLTLEEIRERVQTAELQQLSRLTPDKADIPEGEEWLPDGQQIDTTPEKVEASVNQIMRVLRIGLGLENETEAAEPSIIAGITLSTDWSLPRDWTEIEIVDTTKLRHKAEMGILEQSYGVEIEVLAQNDDDKIVTRYILKNTGKQVSSQRELLETNLKLMSKPSSTRAIVSIEEKPQPTIRIMQGVPLPELLPENWREIEIGATSALGVPTASEEAWGVNIERLAPSKENPKVPRYIISRRDQPQSTRQKMKLMEHLRAMAFPSPSHAILRID